jgi:1,4-alpha-glucan branching enzyme
MWGHPGKKLLFMGQEFAQGPEWNHNAQLDWDAAGRDMHKGVQRLVRDLNTLYRTEPALHVKDCEPEGFQWIDANDADRSLYSWIRRGGAEDANIVVICNFTPVEQPDTVIGLPMAGTWEEVLNTDAAIYGGRNRGNMGRIEATGEGHMGQPASARVMIPPLSTVMLKHAG